MIRDLAGLGLLPRLLIASVCGTCYALGAPPGAHIWLTWLGAIPLILLVRHTEIGWREALGIGLVAGMGIGLGGFPWIAEMLERFAGVPAFVSYIGLLFFSLWMALPLGLWAIAISLGPKQGWHGRVWTVGTIVVLNSAWPNLFPYTVLLGFAERPEWIQLAEWGGVPLLETLVYLFGLLIADAIAAEDPARRIRFAGSAVLIPVAIFAYGDWRMGVIDAEAEGAATLRVGLVQLNVPVEGGHSSRSDLERLRESSKRAQDAGAELIVWPEAGAYPYRVARPIGPSDATLAKRVMKRHALPTVFGASTRDPSQPFGYNTAFLMAPSGEILNHYDKHHLVPLGEYIPVVSPEFVTDRIPQIAHHFAGDGPRRFVFEQDGGTALPPRNVALGPLICYEDIIPSYVRETLAQDGGIDLMVNLTIDAWYGDTAEPWEHLALAQFRSVEHRIPMVRSVITGVSAVIDQNGRLAAHIPLRPVSQATLDDYPPEILVETVALSRNSEDEPTAFARFGWLLPYGWLLMLSVLAALHWRDENGAREA